MRKTRFILGLVTLTAGVCAMSGTPSAHAEDPTACPPSETTAAPNATIEDLKACIEAATARFRDVTYVASIAEKNTKVLQKMEPSF